MNTFSVLASFLKSYYKIFFSILIPSFLIALLDFSNTYILSQVFLVIASPGKGVFVRLLNSPNVFIAYLGLFAFAIFLLLRVFASHAIYKWLYSSVYLSSVSLTQKYFRILTDSYSLSCYYSRDGRLQKLFIEDVSLLTNGLFVPLSGIFVESILIAFMFIYLATFLPLTSIFLPLIIFIPFFLVLSNFLRRRIQQLGIEREATATNRQTIISNLESSLPEIFIYKCFDFASSKLYSINKSFADVNKNHTTIIQINRVAFDSLLTFFVILFFYISSNTSASNTYTAAFAPLVAVLLRLVPSFSRILQLSQGIFYLIPLTVKMQNQFSSDLEISDDFRYSMCLTNSSTDSSSNLNSNKSLYVDNINVSRYGLRLIDSGSLFIPYGSLISIFGRSGSGKSSLARALFLSMRDFGLNVGLVRQRPGSVSSFVIESISLTRTTEVNFSHLQSSIKLAGLQENLFDDTSLSAREISTLSGGQRQRLDLARTFYSDFDYIIFDEFTSALDSHVEYQILQNLSVMCDRGLTVICFSHRTAVKSFSQECYTIQDMKISRLSSPSSSSS